MERLALANRINISWQKCYGGNHSRARGEGFPVEGTGSFPDRVTLEQRPEDVRDRGRRMPGESVPSRWSSRQAAGPARGPDRSQGGCGAGSWERGRRPNVPICGVGVLRVRHRHIHIPYIILFMPHSSPLSLDPFST